MVLPSCVIARVKAALVPTPSTSSARQEPRRLRSMMNAWFGKLEVEHLNSDPCRGAANAGVGHRAWRETWMRS